MREAGDFILFHRTSDEEARRILSGGFRNERGSYLSNRTWAGVWLSACPDGAGEALLAVRLAMTESELARWEWTGEGRPSREWLIPAGVLNAKVSGTTIEEHQDALTAAA